MKNGAPQDELENGRGRGWAVPYNFPIAQDICYTWLSGKILLCNLGDHEGTFYDRASYTRELSWNSFPITHTHVLHKRIVFDLFV